ncbi:hypothetical protein ACHAXM_002192 [Skeletonema potamos]
MTSPSLTIGTSLLAFSPTLTLFFVILLPKPQLVILSVVAAFAYLLSAFGSSLVWLIFNAIFQFTTKDATSSIGSLLALTVPSVLIQCVVRMQFVKLYFNVEDVIRKSVAKHEAETTTTTYRGGGGGNNDNAAATQERRGEEEQQQHSETNALQLQLNDLTCSLASGTGYALLHTLFLFGTLLSSQAHESTNYYGNINNSGGYYGGGGGSTGHGGTLYQYSCGNIMPSLVNGALVGMMFSTLDVFWMMLTFFGMRRRRQRQLDYPSSSIGSRVLAVVHDGLSFWTGIDDSIHGGNAALGLVLFSHLLASLVLAPNGVMEDGCMISLPCLGGVVVLVSILFFRGVKGHFLPMDQRTRIQELRLLGSGGGGDGGGASYHVD